MTNRLAHPAPNALLREALTLLYTAPERFVGVSGAVRNWTDAGIWDAAQAAWRAAQRSRGSLMPRSGRGAAAFSPPGL